MKDNTPTPEARRLAALAESALKFRRSTQDTIDGLTTEMILNSAPIEGAKFKTPGGRNAMIVMAVGDDAVGALTDALNDIQEKNDQ